MEKKKQRKRWGRIWKMAALFGLMGMLAGCGSNKGSTGKIPEQAGTGGGHKSYDYDAPKVIESQDIIKFECVYYAKALGALADANKVCVYEYAGFSMIKTEDGVECEFSGTPRIYDDNTFDLSFTADFDALAELQKIIVEADVASCNGRYGETPGLPDNLGGSISVEYASGESIYAYDNLHLPYPFEVVQPLCTLFERLAGEAGSPAPTRKVEVSEIYSEEGEVMNPDGYGYGYSYHVPLIEDDTPDADKINEEIALWYDKLAEDGLAEAGSNEIPACNSVDYEIYRSGHILSLVLKCAFYYGHYEGYRAYNYDTLGGVWLTNEELLARNGLTEEEYLHAVRRAAAGCYDDWYFSNWEDYDYDGSPGAYQERRLDTISDRNITLDLPLYLNDSDVLRAVVPIGCHGDVDWIYEPLALDFAEDEEDVETAEYGDFLTVKRQGFGLILRFKETEQFRDLLEVYDPYGMLGEPEVPYGRKIEVNGLYGNYVRIFCGSIGDPGAPYIFLLTEEGRVEYIDVFNCLYTGYFCASGPLLGAENVKDFVSEDGNGFPNIYAVTDSGERLDLNDLTMFDRYNMAPHLRGGWSDTHVISRDDGGSYEEYVSLVLSDGNGDNFELTYSQPGEEYVTGISGNLFYLGMTEEGAVYAYRGQGLYSNGPAWQGAIAMSVKAYGIFDFDGADTLYITELGGEPFIGEETGDVTQLLSGSG